MKNELRKPNIEGEAGFDRDELLSEVIPGEQRADEGQESDSQSQSEPIRPYELPEKPKAEDEFHTEIPGHKLKVKPLSEKEAAAEINKLLDGKFEPGDASQVTEFLSNQIGGE